MKRYLWLDEGEEYLARSEGCGVPYSLSDEDLKKLISWGWYESRDHHPLMEHRKIIKCDDETASCNYGEVYAEFSVGYQEDTWYNKQNPRKPLRYFASAHVSSIDDGGWHAWFYTEDPKQAKRQMNRVKNWVNALPGDFNYLKFREFVESEGGEFDAG